MKEGSGSSSGPPGAFWPSRSGAFGAHGLKERLESLGQAANFQTAAHYHMYCALALLAVGLLARSWPLGHGRHRRRLVVLARLA